MKIDSLFFLAFIVSAVGSFFYPCLAIIACAAICAAVLNNVRTSRNTKVKLFDKVCAPERHGDWIDLKARAEVLCEAGHYYQIPLGIAMKMPDGYEAHLLPRSSTFKHHGLIQTNGVGIIDNGYSGDNDEWAMPVYATRDTAISKGERVAQFRLVPSMSNLHKFKVVTHLDDKNRGGFGSTGK